MNTSTVDTRRIPLRLIGTSCPWRIVAPADLSKVARGLEAARTRPWMRALLARQAGATGDSFSPEEDVTTTGDNLSPKAAAPEPITWGGHDVDAPGFTQDQFNRAMGRAFADDLRVKQLRDGSHVVSHPGVTHGYRVGRERCTCRAGEVGTPCKHRAVLIAHLDIRIPHVDRQWQKLQAARPAQPVEVA